MDSQRVERALIAEIVAEMERQRYTNRAMQQRTGIRPRTWSNYKDGSSPIPTSAVYAIAAVLGLSGSELYRRAEARAAAPVDPEQIAAAALAQLSPEAQAEIAKVAEGLRLRGPSSAPKRAAGQ